MYGYREGRVYKKPGVEAFQTVVAHLVRLAKPKGWLPASQIRLTYDYRLHRRADCDNLQKALNDAIAFALGVDDDRFLPCSNSKTTGASKLDAKIIIGISNA